MSRLEEESFLDVSSYTHKKEIASHHKKSQQELAIVTQKVSTVMLPIAPLWHVFFLGKWIPSHHNILLEHCWSKPFSPWSSNLSKYTQTVITNDQQYDAYTKHYIQVHLNTYFVFRNRSFNWDLGFWNNSHTEKTLLAMLAPTIPSPKGAWKRMNKFYCCQEK